MTTIWKSLAVLSVLILTTPFCLADQAAAADRPGRDRNAFGNGNSGTPGSDYYDGNNTIARNDDSYYRSPTAAALPGNCVAVTYDGVAYLKCGNSWVQPRYQGFKVVYVRVKPPY